MTSGHFDIRGVLLQFTYEGVGANNEIAAVPQITRPNIACGDFTIGLFTEGLDVAQAAPHGLDIAICGRRGGRLDAKGDNAASIRPARRLAHSAPEGDIVWNVMIGSQEDIDAVCIVVAGPDGGSRHGRRRIPGLRLQQHLGVDPDLFQLVENPVAVADAPDNDQSAALGSQRRNPQNRLLEKRAIARQGNELLGPRRS